MGNYVQNNLMAGEAVQHEGRLHWMHWMGWVFASLLTVGLLSPFLLIPLVRQLTSEFVVTDRRIILKVGLISRRTFEMNLNKVETVGIGQSIIGRILNYGTVSVVGSGGTGEAFPFIARPLDFRRAVNDSTSNPSQVA